MGYHTNFNGHFTIVPVMTDFHRAELAALADQDHRDNKVIMAEIGNWGYYCQWIVSDDGTKLQWDDGEKFYSYIEWLKYLVKHYFKPWGYKLNGEIIWQGEDIKDRGLLKMKDTVLTVKNLK